jgi:hypothetical protein
MEEYVEPGLGETVERPVVESFFRSAEGSVMLALNSTNELAGFIFGIFPLFIIALDSVNRFVGGGLSVTGFYVSSTAQRKGLGVGSGLEGGLATGLELGPGLGLGLSADNREIARQVQKVNINMLSCGDCSFRWLEHSASVYLMMQADLSKLQVLILLCYYYLLHFYSLMYCMCLCPFED